jgi:hypothetical protein
MPDFLLDFSFNTFYKGPKFGVYSTVECALCQLDSAITNLDTPLCCIGRIFFVSVLCGTAVRLLRAVQHSVKYPYKVETKIENVLV